MIANSKTGDGYFLENTKKNKGFTLIELLAVIVILAVIALIATPIITNIINGARKEAAKDSAYGYIEALEYNNSISEIGSNNGLENGTYKVNDLKSRVNIRGNKPTYGTVTIENNKVVSANLCIGGYIVSYDGLNAKALSSCTEKEDETVPDIVIGTISGTTNSLTIPFTAIDEETGIESVSCFYSTDKSYNLKGKIENNECKLSNLKNDTLYNFKIEATNNGGIKGEIAGSHKTGNFESIEILVSPSDWSSSKKVTIKGSTAGSTLEYKVVSGTTVKTDWTKYTSDITVDWAANINTPTYIYARLNDNVNVSETANLTITKIDTTEPVLNLSTATSTTNSITVPISTSDSESGIKSTTCSYGLSTSYGSKGVISSNNCSMSGLKNNTTYYYQVTTTNNAGLTTTKTGSVKTGEFSGIEVTASPSDWSSSKKVTIKGSTAGATLEYKIVSGTTVKQNWTKYTSDITVDWAANVNTPTYIYARLNDNVNISETASLTITKIDITAPTLSLSNASVTTNSIIVPISTSDSESGIKSTTCSYGVSTSYGSKGVIGLNNCSMSGLKNNTTYYYQVTTTNNAGLTTTKTGSVKTGEFSGIEVMESPSDWSSSKKVTIKGSTAGSTLEYKVVSGTTVKNDWTKYTSDITVDWAANINTPTYIYARLNDNVNVSETANLTITKVDITAPTLNLSTATSTTNSITVPISASDSESGIKSTTCSYGLSTSYGSKGVISSNNCSMSGLKNNTTYYYQVTTTNNAGLTTTKTGSVKTGEFSGIEVTASPSDWSSSKKVTIKGSTAGSTLEYRVVSGTTVKNDWTKYTSDITIDWAANVNTPTYIYARLNDNVNVSETASLTITKIDTTAPTLSLANASVTTNSITVPISTSDSESGIKSTTCSYGLSTSYGSKGVISSNNCVMSGLKNNTAYYYQVTTTNNAGLTTTKTGNIKTGEFASVEIEATPSDWSSSKNVSIKGSTAGATLEYKIVSGTTVKQNWTKYTSDITVDWAANTTTPTYIYARLNDNVNVSETASLTITKVDTTAPILTFKEITSTTKDITISFASNSDSESGIKSTVCKYGTSSDNYNLTGKVNSDKTNCVIEGTANSTYFYQITTTNNAGLTKTVTGNTKTQAFSSIKINLSPVDWSSSKNITIDGVTSGATLEYKVVSGTTIKTNWTEYKGNFVIDWAASVSNPTYIYARFNDSKNYSDEESLTITKIDTTAPTLNLQAAVTTTNSIVIPATISDSESGIKSTTCSYGVSTNYGSKGVIGENNCSMSGLKNNTTYYYQVTTTNNAGLTTTKTGSAKTGQFGGIEVTASPSDWSNSKKVTIKGSTAGATLEYKVVSGTTVKTDWTKYTSDITVNWAANTTTPTYIYARLNDNVNVSETASLTITKVDTTAPTEASLTATTYTDRVTLNAVCTDKESGIKKYEYSKDNGASWVTGTSSAYVFDNLDQGTSYTFKVRCTNNVSLTKEGSLTKATNTIVAPTLSTTAGVTASKDITITFNGTNIVSPSYYVKGTVSSSSSISVTESCGTDTNPGTCTKITSTKTLQANTWYKVSSNVVLTVTDNGSFYAATKDSKNLKAGATLTITSIAKQASDIYYNNSAYTNGDITVQEAIEDLYKKLQ